MDKRSQKTYPVFVRNPLKAIRNWSKQDKKQALVSIALATLILAQAEMISLPKTPADLLYLPLPILIMSPFVWLFLMIILAAFQNFKEWIERD